LKLNRASFTAIRKQKRNAVIKRQVPVSLATVHERPCLQKDLAVEDTEQVLNKVDDGDSETVDEQYTPGCDGKLIIEDHKELGMAFVTQEEMRVAIKVAYVIEYREPNESEWGQLQLVSMCDGELALQPSRMCSGGFAMEIKS
jgi:hypothetical protein